MTFEQLEQFPQLAAELKALRARVAELEAASVDLARKLGHEKYFGDAVKERDRLREELAGKVPYAETVRPYEADLANLREELAVEKKRANDLAKPEYELIDYRNKAVESRNAMENRLPDANATIGGLREALCKAIVFMQYARYELPAKHKDFEQFPCQECCDREIERSESALTRTPSQHQAAIEAGVLREASKKLKAKAGVGRGFAYKFGFDETAKWLDEWAAEADRIEKEAQDVGK